MRHGYSMLEVIIAALLLALVMSIAASTILSGSQETEAVVQVAELTRKVGQARDRVSHELRYAAADSASVVAGDLVFRKALIDVVDGSVGLSAAHRLGFTYTTDDPDNGKDDDGDGLIDEGVMYFIGDSGLTEVLIADVLEGSFRVELPGGGTDVFVVRFQVAGRRFGNAGNFTQTPNSAGVYPDQAGFLLVSAEERVRARN